MIMKRVLSLLALPILTVNLASFGFAQSLSDRIDRSQSDNMARGRAEGFILKREAADSNYCHMKFPAIDEKTLSSRHPVLKPRNSGDIVDLYGPCDFDPKGVAAIDKQKQDLSRSWDREYSG
jgi:hypothetical protein